MFYNHDHHIWLLSVSLIWCTDVPHPWLPYMAALSFIWCTDVPHSLPPYMAAFSFTHLMHRCFTTMTTIYGCSQFHSFDAQMFYNHDHHIWLLSVSLIWCTDVPHPLPPYMAAFSSTYLMHWCFTTITTIYGCSQFHSFNAQMFYIHYHHIWLLSVSLILDCPWDNSEQQTQSVVFVPVLVYVFVTVGNVFIAAP